MQSKEKIINHFIRNIFLLILVLSINISFYCQNTNTWNGSVGNSWLNTANWDLGLVPSVLDNVVIPNVANQPLVSSNINIGSLTINTGGEITIVSNVFAVSGITDIDGTLNIDLGTYDANGTFDANGGAINFTANGILALSDLSVTSLGNMNSNMGTVKYDGNIAQNVISDTYYNLTIDNSSTKTVTGNLVVKGALTIEDDLNCILDLNTSKLKLKGDLVVGNQGFLDASDAACRVVFFGSDSRAAEITDYVGTIPTTEEETVIFEGPTIWTDSPFNADQPFGYVRCMYTEDEIGIEEMSINSLYIFVDNPSNFVFTGSIYIGTISNAKTEFSNTDDDNYPDLNLYEQVLSNESIVFNTAGWVEIDIDDYEHSGTGGLEIIFENHTNATGTGPGIALYDLSDGLTENRMIWSYQGNDNFGGGTRGRYLLNMRFKKTTQTPINLEASFNDLKLNGGGDLTLSTPTKIKGVLTLNNGNIIASSINTLTLENTSSTAISGGSVSSHIIGPFDRITNSSVEYVFPVGDGNSYRPVYVTPNSNVSTTYSIEFNNTAHTFNGNSSEQLCDTGLDHVAPESWWNISRIAGSADCFIGLNWDATSGVDVPLDIRLAHWDGAKWENLGQTLTGNDGSLGGESASAGRVSSDALVTNFSPFNLGSSGSGNPLPIDLLSFDVDCNNDEILVSFSILSQVNNDYFMIERSVDAVNWESIGHIEGAITTNHQFDYLFVDVKPHSGLSYYRLTQVDFDGQQNTYYPASANCYNELETLPVHIYPNPASDQLMIEIDLHNYQGDNSRFTIKDMTGKKVLSDYIEMNRGFNKYVIDINQLPSGVYFLSFNNTKEPIVTTRIIKSN